MESVEPFTSVQGGLQGLVIGEVMTCEKHPDADRLRVTTVNVGKPELLNIVCGAPNVATGQKVIVALPGCKLYPADGEPFEIKKSKIRGQASEGMICAEDEIGIGNSHAGIIVLEDSVKVGMPASEYYKIENDFVYEIGLTPNRADAASHIGVARDLAALLNHHEKANIKINYPKGIQIDNEQNLTDFSVNVESPEACARYSGIVLNNITVSESPEWLKNRLKAVGVRSINNIVDVTNFVLHELGQPLHAFDADKIKGKKVIVRKSKASEKFTTLDEVQRNMDSEDLLICDEASPMCIAGVFGGIASGVTGSTKNIFLESAYFDSVHIRKTSRRHGLKTDASFRFERGTDPNVTVKALERAAQLILEVSGGTLSPGLIDIYPKPVENFKVGFSYVNCDRLIGKEIERSTIRNIIKSLDIEILSEGTDALLLSVPPYKVDVTREADVIEEVLRIYGYNNIEDPAFIRSSVPAFPKPDTEKIKNNICDYLANSGFSEIVSNSLTKSAYLEFPGFSNKEAVKVLNPLSSDLDILRTESVFSGLEAIVYNQNRKSSDLRFFECGKIYYRQEDRFIEEDFLSVFATGKKNSESWNARKENVDFFFLKGIIENILRTSGIKTSIFSIVESAGLSEAMGIFVGKKQIGIIGQVSTSLLKSFDIQAPVFFASFDVSSLIKYSSFSITTKEIPKYPSVRRDLALLLDSQVTFSQVEEIARKTEKSLLKNISLFDIYEGDKLPKGKKSYAVSFTLLDDNSTLTDKQIDKVMEKLMSAYTEQLGAEIRGK